MLQRFSNLGVAQSDEGWWDPEKMLKQVVERALSTFERAYPGVLPLIIPAGMHAKKAMHCQWLQAG